MKKNIILIVFFLIAYSAFSQEVITIGSGTNSKGEEMEGQSLDMATVRVYYHFTQKERAKDKTAFRDDQMTLDIGAQMSHYYDETKARKDSIALLPLSNLNLNSVKSISVYKEDQENVIDNSLGDKYEHNYFDGNSEKVYKNRLNGEITIIDNSSGLYRCEDPVGILDWEITQDTATIFNYSCQKAKVRFRGRNYEVWFAPEIPVNDGPWKFFGLPGLIVKVEDTDRLIAFECVGLQYLENPYAIAIPKGKYIKCNRKELEKAIKTRGSSTNININAGNITIASKGLSPSFQFLELE
jgi:GLPGLI family protein